MASCSLHGPCLAQKNAQGGLSPDSHLSSWARRTRKTRTIISFFGFSISNSTQLLYTVALESKILVTGAAR